MRSFFDSQQLAVSSTRLFEGSSDVDRLRRLSDIVSISHQEQYSEREQQRGDDDDQQGATRFAAQIAQGNV